MAHEPFIFRASPTFVDAGYESASGEWSDQSAQEISKLRTNYPELTAWGDLAIGLAWGGFSSDVMEVNWCEWLVHQRDELFLSYCYWRQTQGEWYLGWDVQQASGWKKTPTGAAT